MSLETAIEALTKAVVDNTNAITGKVTTAPKATKESTKPAKTEEPKTEEAKPAKPAAAKKGPTIEDVRAALRAYAAIESKEAAIAIIKEFGADTLPDLDPEKYEEVIAKAKA